MVKSLTEIKAASDKAVARKELLTEQQNTRKSDLVLKQALLKAEEEAQVLIQTVAQETQEQVRFHLQDMVQAALDAVFPGAYDFMVEFVLKRGRTEVSMYLEKDGTEMDPMDSTGGGIVDIISTSLRIACWSISRTANTIIMDEPFKFLSSKYRSLLGEMLQQVSQKLGLQIIMVTHDPDMVNAADRVFRIDQKSRKSFVAEVSE